MGDQVGGGGPGLGFGTVSHPEPEPPRNGPVPAIARSQLRGLPRRRRPAMIALAAALIGARILGSAALYQRQDHQVPVVMITTAVPGGAVIPSGDVGTTTVAAQPRRPGGPGP